jgi:hypothetical protein
MAEQIPVVEVSVLDVYARARGDARNALLVGRRDINRLATMSLGLGDDHRAEAEVCISKLETLMELLENAP